MSFCEATAEKIKTGGLITLSRLRRSVQNCRIGQKKPARVIKRARLANGYLVMAKLNRQMAEECLVADNGALTSGVENLTECEIK